MAEGERFVDNGDGTLTDTKYKLMWLKVDSYQKRDKWCSWKGAHKFVARLNEKKLGGHEDWRLPKSQECRNLYDHDSKNTDFNGDIIRSLTGASRRTGSTPWRIIFTATAVT